MRKIKKKSEIVKIFIYSEVFFCSVIRYGVEYRLCALLSNEIKIEGNMSVPTQDNH